MLRMQIAGVDMAGYVRFAMITPEILVSANGHRHAGAPRARRLLRYGAAEVARLSG